MKNISLILNAVLLLLIGHLYYLHYSSATPVVAASDAIEVPASVEQHGVKIAYVNADTLDAKYEWLNDQKKALDKRLQNAESSMMSKKQTLAKELDAFQQKYESGSVPPAQLQGEYEALMKRQESLASEEQRLSKSLSDDYQKTSKDLMTNVETQLKSLQSQIGYDYILSYSKGGGQVLLANDSLDITRQVLELLNAQKKQ